MLTLFPKFKKRLILFEVLYVALMVVLKRQKRSEG